LPPDQAAALAATAARLAQAAGTQITAAVNGELAVHFKATRREWAANSNPVSEVDQSVERYIRAQLLQTHPHHTVIGEEQAQSGPPDARISWVIDPVDGTCNFINGVPLYACSIGVLHDGWPVAGAIFEFAWVACGLLRLAHMPGPGLWDAAAGLSLLHAAGCSALTWEHGRWTPLLRFKPPGRQVQGGLAAWKQPVLIGAAEDLAAALQARRPG
jgi:fructose-1,6-bisphosphatase/inositol monophosphatase family enzyme